MYLQVAQPGSDARCGPAHSAANGSWCSSDSVLQILKAFANITTLPLEVVYSSGCSWLRRAQLLLLRLLSLSCSAWRGWWWRVGRAFLRPLWQLVVSLCSWRIVGASLVYLDSVQRCLARCKELCDQRMTDGHSSKNADKLVRVCYCFDCSCLRPWSLAKLKTLHDYLSSEARTYP